MHRNKGLSLLLFLIAIPFCVASWGVTETVRVEVAAEEKAYDFISPDNGSGPLWSFGCTPIARIDNEVVLCQMETGKDVPKLCNTRWRLLHRTETGWQCFAEADEYRQREPAVLAALSNGRIVLNVNDSVEAPGTHYGRTEPKLLCFDGAPLNPAYNAWVPQWNRACHFTDHSYRGYAADRDHNQLLMFNIDATTSIQHWALLNDSGSTLCHGEIKFPIRACYPHAAIRNHVAHILAISDIVEPVQEWKQYKYEQTKRDWDYVFRILYYSATNNIEKTPFSSPLEIANVENTCGAITGQDLWAAPDGAAYILYTQADVASELIRDRFFPGKSVLPSLYLAVVKDGQLLERRRLIEGREEAYPGTAKFHEHASGNVYILAYLSGSSNVNLLLKASPTEREIITTLVPFAKPFTSFLLANTRSGNKPSDIVDIMGHRDVGTEIWYGQIRIHENTSPR